MFCSGRGHVGHVGQVCHLGMLVVLAHRRVGLGQAELLALGLFHAELEEGVVVQHLLDFLAELERGQLQQPDGLLELWREGQVL